jgi:hypothetical protein
VISEKKDQLLGLLLQETETHYIVGYPSRCFSGDDDLGNPTYTVIPYSRLPYVTLSKQSCSLVAPLHAECEYYFYKYICDTSIDNRDFKYLLTKHGFDSDLSKDHYSKRALKVKRYCDSISHKNTKEDVLDIPEPSQSTLH